jgi:hypothetical protein
MKYVKKGILVLRDLENSFFRNLKKIKVIPFLRQLGAFISLMVESIALRR